ncbi:hypothetical protein V6U90_11495 [Micromonospora sp. CPCC 206060]|uniref:hypothetical protein n=1 Tax=Micromonospora sp. CPCC 206060 TaxID=3122406 RepID=UPI002FEF9656
MGRAGRRTGAVLGAGLLLLVTGCGPDTPGTSSPAVPVSGQPGGTPSGTPGPGGGYLPFVEAVDAFLDAGNPGGDHRFVGRCAEVTPVPGAFCAVPVGRVDAGEVFGIGLFESEIDAYLLMVPGGDDGWRVVDSYSLPPLGERDDPAKIPAWVAEVESGR